MNRIGIDARPSFTAAHVDVKSRVARTSCTPNRLFRRIVRTWRRTRIAPRKLPSRRRLATWDSRESRSAIAIIHSRHLNEGSKAKRTTTISAISGVHKNPLGPGDKRASWTSEKESCYRRRRRSPGSCVAIFLLLSRRGFLSRFHLRPSHRSRGLRISHFCGIPISSLRADVTKTVRVRALRSICISFRIIKIPPVPAAWTHCVSVLVFRRRNTSMYVYSICTGY